MGTKPLKQGVLRRLLGDAEHFWQKRYYDFNIRNYPEFVEKERCIHRNPVKRGLCQCPEDWPWSSFRHDAIGCEGRVEIESEWAARKRSARREDCVQLSNCPLKPKSGLSGPPVKKKDVQVMRPVRSDAHGDPLLSWFARASHSRREHGAS